MHWWSNEPGLVLSYASDLSSVAWKVFSRKVAIQIDRTFDNLRRAQQA